MVEDEPAIAKAESMILKEHEVHHASDGEQAMKLAHEIMPDVVILDLMLPKRTGYDVCFNLRQDPKFKDTKIVMVTAKNAELDEDKGMLIGADDYITKPFEPDELLHVVSQVLSKD